MYIAPPIFEIRRAEIPSAIRSLAEDLGRIGELALIEIAANAIQFYQQEIAGEGSVDTGHFLNTVRVQRQSWHERVIGSDAFYSGVVRRKRSGEVIGPMFVERTISRLGPSVESAFARQLAR